LEILKLEKFPTDENRGQSETGENVSLSLGEGRP